MSNTLSEQEKKLYRQTDEVLHYMWDPIGVRGIAQTRDEYHSYLAKVFSMLIEDVESKVIAEYLENIDSKSMGLNPDKENALHIAQTLLGMREAILEDGF